MKKTTFFYGWWIVLASAVLLAVLGPASVALANLFQTPVTEEFGITNSQFAISNSIVLGVGIFLSPYISQKLARESFKLVYSIGVLSYGLGFIGFGFAPNIYVFYILSFFVGYGFMSTTIMPVSMLINNWFSEKRGFALSLALAGLGVGGTIFSQIVTLFIVSIRWRQTYMLYGAFMLAVALPITWFLLKASPEEMNLMPYGTNRDTPENDRSKETIEKIKGVHTPLKQTRTKPFFILLIVGAVLVGLVNNGGLGQFPPVLYTLHGPAVSATVISIYSAVGIIGKLTLGNIHDRYGTVISILYTSILLAITYVLMMFAGNIVLVYVMAVFFGLGNAIGTVSPPLVTSSIYSADNFPQAYGYVQSGIQLGMTFGSLFAAGIADLTGTYTASWAILAIGALFIAVSWIGSYTNSKQYIKLNRTK